MNDKNASTYSWKSLDDELERWSRLGRKATFWWRDDDACAATPELEILLKFSEQMCVPMSLAVIPAKLQDSLHKRLQTSPLISILQHGYRHENHAPASEKKSEFGAHRPIAGMLADLQRGRSVLQHYFGDRFFPVVVPPWNRYAIDLLASLQAGGFDGVSGMWARDSEQTPEGLLQVNTHIDPVAWRHDRGFIGENDAMEQVVCHLRLRREWPQLGDEPTGLLSHHLDQTESVWQFCRQFADRINADENCGWLSAGDIWR